MICRRPALSFVLALTVGAVACGLNPQPGLPESTANIPGQAGTSTVGSLGGTVSDPSPSGGSLTTGPVVAGGVSNGAGGTSMTPVDVPPTAGGAGGDSNGSPASGGESNSGGTGDAIGGATNGGDGGASAGQGGAAGGQGGAP